MAVYSVFEPPERNNDAADDTERFAFVRDGFSWAAFALGPIWMLWHRLWLVLIGYFGAVAALAIGMYVDGFDSGIEGWAWFLLAVLVGLEASSLRRWTLTRRGWNDLGIVVADDLEAAERRFFAAWAASEREPWPAAARLRMPRGNDVIGLFPEPGANR
jgi:Protein of unknown function (DUF2628)